MYLVLHIFSKATYLLEFSRVTEQELLNKLKLQVVFPDLPFSNPEFFLIFFMYLLCSHVLKNTAIFWLFTKTKCSHVPTTEVDVLLCLINVSDHKSQVCFELLQENAIDNKRRAQLKLTQADLLPLYYVG